MTYAEVVVSTPIRRQVISGQEEEGPENKYSPLSLAFHYSIPPALEEKAAIGQLVQVPFGPRRLQGIVRALLSGQVSRLRSGSDHTPAQCAPQEGQSPLAVRYFAVAAGGILARSMSTSPQCTHRVLRYSSLSKRSRV